MSGGGLKLKVGYRNEKKGKVHFFPFQVYVCKGITERRENSAE